MGVEIEAVNPVYMVFLRAVIAILAAGFGGLLGMGRDRFSHRVLCSMVSLAAGALLAVTVVHIVPETFEILGTGNALAGLAAGTLLFAGIGKFVYFVCPACAASASERDTGYIRLGILLMVAMGIHSTVDGLAITAGCHSEHAAGLLILLAVSYHKVPEGLALVSVARLAGYSRAKALGVTLLIETTTALGAFIGLIFLSGVSELMLGITLAVVAGSFIYTIGFALLKEMYAHEKGSILVYVALGFASIMAISSVMERLGLHHQH